jgi:hypothetical protein
MYDPLNFKPDPNDPKKRGLYSGVQAVSDWVGQFTPEATPDGLQIQPPPQGSTGPFLPVIVPDFLMRWLRDLRLLRNIPLCYLVPDASLLPPESIRFFHVDYMWLDRVIDGVFSAANLGTVDQIFTYGYLKAVRDQLDTDLENLAKSLSSVSWRPGINPMTGCLIRSELIRRWPDLIVTAYANAAPPPPLTPTLPPKVSPPLPQPTKPLAVLRAETISTDVYIALFGGQPMQIQIMEPQVGMRFGVEGDNTVKPRDTNGDQTGGKPQKVNMNEKRTLDIKSLFNSIPTDPKDPNRGRARMLALQLERPAWVQDFQSSTDEAKGSVSPLTLMITSGPFITLRGGRTMKLDKLAARLAEAEQRSQS